MDIVAFDWTVENEKIKHIESNIKLFRKISTTFGNYFLKRIRSTDDLANIVNEFYNTESAILRAEKLTTKNGKDTIEHKIAISKLSEII